MDIAKEILDYVERRVEEAEFQKEYKTKEQDFVRKRKLDFAKVVNYILGNNREGVELGKEKYCQASGVESISAAALTKARYKIKYTGIEALFEETAQLIPTPRREQGYEVIAVDGMTGELPKTRAIKERYKETRSRNHPMFHAVAAYDVNNEIYLAADIAEAPANEREMAIELLKHPCFAKERKQILLYDRGFPSVALIQALNSSGKKYIMRVSSSFVKEVNAFAKGKRNDQEIEIHYSKRRGATSRVCAQLPCDFVLRCVRLNRKEGKQMICITNLEREEFPRRIIDTLYTRRWGIETGFNFLKNTVFIEEFSSTKAEGIKQDIYATLWNANLINVLFNQAGELPDSGKKKTHL